MLISYSYLLTMVRIDAWDVTIILQWFAPMSSLNIQWFTLVDKYKTLVTLHKQWPSLLSGTTQDCSCMKEYDVDIHVNLRIPFTYVCAHVVRSLNRIRTELGYRLQEHVSALCFIACCVIPLSTLNEVFQILLEYIRIHQIPFQLSQERS